MSEMNWKEIAKFLDVSEHIVIVNWYKEKSTLPYKIVKKIVRKYPFENFEKIKIEWVEKILEKNWGQKLVGNRNLKIKLLFQIGYLKKKNLCMEL